MPRSSAGPRPATPWRRSAAPRSIRGAQLAQSCIGTQAEQYIESTMTHDHKHGELPIRFAGGTLDRSRHVCAFFDSFDEEIRVLGPFVKEGLERGEKAFHIVDPEQRDN